MRQVRDALWMPGLNCGVCPHSIRFSGGPHSIQRGLSPFDSIQRGLSPFDSRSRGAPARAVGELGFATHGWRLARLAAKEVA